MTVKRPLEGIRILDLGMFMAGPYGGGILADLGAEVIKVESCRRPDPLRIQARGIYPDGKPGEKPWNRSGMINDRNRNKLGITLDLNEEKGRAIFERLVKVSDVVLENYSRRAARNMKLEYEHLNKANPQIIVVSMTSQGLTGPHSDDVSFGPTLEQIGGLAYLTGYPDEMSAFTSFAFPDAMAGVLAVGATIAALRYRKRSGEGMHIDLAQREMTVGVTGEVLMDYMMNRRVHKAEGNRHPVMSPYGCYPCSGTDRWITIAIDDDAKWTALCRLMGKPELIASGKFADTLARRHNADELDRIVGEWTKNFDHYELTKRLQDAGVIAGPVLTIEEIFQDEHYRERSFLRLETHPESGTHIYKGRPMQLSKTPLKRDAPAPGLGQHNRYLFGSLLGMTDDELAELEKEGIIGTVPNSKDLQFT